MNSSVAVLLENRTPALEAKAIERDFPIAELSLVAERESWRKEINRPLYHIHKWWATRLGSVFRAITLGSVLPAGRDIWHEFYRTHDFRDKVILDPFMGSGTTLGEALKLGCRVVGCDINPVSTFLVRQSLTPVSEAALRAAFAHLERTVAPRIRQLYQTNDPDTGTAIPVLYFFWVKEVDTPLGESMALFDRYVFAQNAYPKKKPIARLLCPACRAIFRDRYDSTASTCPNCGNQFDPQDGPADGQFVRSADGTRYRIKDLLPKVGPPRHRLYACLALRPTGEKVYLRATEADVANYRDAERQLEAQTLPLPTMSVRPGHNTDQARGYNYFFWRDFFNARQLLALGWLLKAIQTIPERTVREQLLCLFSSTLEFNNIFCSFKGEGTGAVRHMFSNHILKPERLPLENSVWGTDRSSGTFASLFESRLIRAKQYLDAPFEITVAKDLLGASSGSAKVIASHPISAPIVEQWQQLIKEPSGALVLNGDSASLPVPNESVDAVITDPPYFDFVHYSELSDFFFAWLSPVLRSTYPWFSKSDSSDPGEVQQKDPQTFAAQLARVFKEAARVLKPDGVLAFSFHHSRPEGWAAIQDALAAAGFEIVHAHPVHAELKAASPKTAARDPISLDAILVCRKQCAGFRDRTSLDVAVDRAFTRSSALRRAGITMSDADYFVVAAAYVLVHATEWPGSFDKTVAVLGQAKTLCAERLALARSSMRDGEHSRSASVSSLEI